MPSCVTVEKAAPGDAHYAVKGLPSSHELKSEGAADALPRALDTAQFDDVGPAAEAPKTDPVAVTFKTFDGLVLSMTVTGTKGDYWLVAKASVDEAARDAFAKGEGSAAVPASGDVDKEAQDLDKRLSGWAYKLPQYLADDLLVTRSTFVTPKTQPESKSKAK